MKSKIRHFFRKTLKKLSSAESIAPRIEGDDFMPLNIFLMGTCQLEILAKASHDCGHKITHVLTGSFTYSEIPQPPGSADLSIFFPTLRDLLSEASGLRQPASDIALVSLSREKAELILQKLKHSISEIIYNLASTHSNKLIIITSIFEPSFEYVGELVVGDRLVSTGEIVHQINTFIRSGCSKVENIKYLDINSIINYVGRRYLQDDVILHTSHASFINDWDYKLDLSRINVPKLISSGLAHDKALADYVSAFWYKIENIYKIINQQNPIKLIIVDLDDTLWRGVAAEDDGISDFDRIEGWPLGFVEALLYFKARGGLLAICSKNDHDSTIERLEKLYPGTIGIKDFVSIKINWNPKSLNIAEILTETNLQANNCLFIDDNDRELSEVKSVHKNIRCLGTDHYNWRRMIMHSPDAQIANLSEESINRTELTRAMVRRAEDMKNSAQASPGRDAWLSSLNIRQSVFNVNVNDGKIYSRVFELLNKTNQFNTTGKRWSDPELTSFFATGGLCLATSVRDNSVDNGLVGVCLIKDNQIIQVVLSCRVFGLGVEYVLGSQAVKLILEKNDIVIAKVLDSGRNATCHDYYTKMGFSNEEGAFVTRSVPAVPAHISIT